MPGCEGCIDAFDTAMGQPGFCGFLAGKGMCVAPKPPGTYADVCLKSCGKCNWECMRKATGKEHVTANKYMFAALDAAAPTLARESSTCAVLKNANLCGLVRTHGVCNQSCPAWPGGCHDVVGWVHEQYARTCAYVEQDRQCSLATLDNAGAGWQGATPLQSLVNEEGIGAYQACCQCGGGTYPERGAITTDPQQSLPLRGLRSCHALARSCHAQ